MYESQENTAACIRRMIVNMKKDSSTRKTAEYVSSCRTTLQQLWSDFEANHAELVKQKEDEHPYFKNNFFEQTKIMSEEGLALLNKYEATLPAPRVPAWPG